MAAVTPLALILGLSLQAAPAATADSCTTGRIAAVDIRNGTIFDEQRADSAQHIGWAYRLANKLHVRTRPWVIRRELLFGVGDCFDAFRLEESERLLRSTEFLSRATITSEQLDDGSHRVIVDTDDEWTTRVDVRVSAHGYGVRAVEENVLGTGQSLGVFYIDRDVTRDYGASYYTPQLLGTRWDMRAEVGSSRAGTFVREEISYPWVGEVSKWASLQSFRREDQFFDYIGSDDPDLRAPRILLPIREKSFNIAMLRRIGPTGNTALAGLALGYQQISYPGIVELAPEGDFDQRMPADTATQLAIAGQHALRNNIRVFALFGHRTIEWVRRRGMDSMHGEEDVRLGAEMGIAVGRSLPSLERDNDFYTTLSLYTGMELGPALVIARVRGDGRRSLTARDDQPEWEDFYGDGEILTYYRPGGNEHHLLFLRASGIGAWNTRTPFQLTLGGERGVRGYDRERFPGGRRLVANLEDRIYFGWPYADVVDLGATVFADAGRVWPGDVPFGVSSGWQTSAGVGLRMSFPASSRVVYRADIAWPLAAGTGFGDFRLQLSLGETIGMNPRSLDQQVVRSRPSGAAGQLFPFGR